MKKWTVFLGIILVFAAVTGVVSGVKDHNYLTDRVIRLHVVANSDTPADQQLKLQVRDGISAWLARQAEPELSAQEAALWLQQQLPNLQAVAEESAAAAGWTGPISVRFGREAFPTREYETFSLPAGVYRSLRVTIGQGQGKNWWCVVFPSLCVPATAEQVEQTAVGAGFSQTLTKTITAEQGYEVRFFLLDWVGRLKNFFFRE